jgi:hypothetical protein
VPGVQVSLVLRRGDPKFPAKQEIVHTLVYRDAVASSSRSASPVPHSSATPPLRPLTDKHTRVSPPTTAWEKGGSGLEALVKSLGGVVRRLSGSGADRGDKKEHGGRIPSLGAWLWESLLLSYSGQESLEEGIIGCPQAAAAQLLMFLHGVSGSQRDLAMAELRSVCTMVSLEQETEEFEGTQEGSKSAHVKLVHSWWVPKGCKVDRAYAARASKRFGADVYCRNQGGSNPGDVRGWVLLNSDCRMQHVLPPLPPHCLTLLSCVRVRAHWSDAFNPAETHVAKFWREKEGKNVYMMRRSGTVRCREVKVRVTAPFTCTDSAVKVRVTAWNSHSRAQILKMDIHLACTEYAHTLPQSAYTRANSGCHMRL